MNALQVTFQDETKAVYHVAIGTKIQWVIEDLEQETGKPIIAFKWL